MRKTLLLVRLRLTPPKLSAGVIGLRPSTGSGLRADGEGMATRRCWLERWQVRLRRVVFCPPQLAAVSFIG